MTEYEKMIASQPYNCMAQELDAIRRETACRYRRFNRAEEEEQLALLKFRPYVTTENGVNDFTIRFD